MTTIQDLNRVTRARSFAESGAARSIRLAADLSLREVASAAGVSVSTVWRWEHGERRPRGDAAVRYGAVLDELMEARR
jgi:transcriptional regulator with XRE-family HTH domain